MFGMSTTELLIVLIVALVVLGPDRLPSMARSFGRMMREFRKASREIQTSLEVEDVRQTIKERVAREKAAMFAGSDREDGSDSKKGSDFERGLQPEDESDYETEPELDAYLAALPKSRRGPTSDGQTSDE